MGPGGSIGVDIGGTKCLGVLLGPEGTEPVAEIRMPTPRTATDLVDTVVDVCRALGGSSRVGVGAPGLVDGRGTLRFAPNLPGITELPIGGLVAEALPDSVVVVDNDATCAVLAETAPGGAAPGERDVLLVAIGTGIGGGLALGGRVHRGRNGFAGEIGHIVVDPQGPLCPCGQRGCWERYASGSGLGWMAREAALAGQAARVVDLAGGDPEAVRGEHVTVAAGEGDAEAAAIVKRFAWWLALGLANLANALDPGTIVLGGGMIESGPVILDPTRKAFAELVEGVHHRPPIAIVPAVLGERAGAVGAAMLARDGWPAR